MRMMSETLKKDCLLLYPQKAMDNPKTSEHLDCQRNTKMIGNTMKAIISLIYFEPCNFETINYIDIKNVRFFLADLEN